MENLTDSQLVTLYIDGNTKAFDGLVNRYGQIVYRFLFKLLGNSEEARDSAQETFIKAWKHIKKFDRSKNFKTWLFTIARRTAIDYLRKKKNINFSTLDSAKENEDADFGQNIPDSELMPNELFERSENIELIQKALETLSLEHKTILLLHDGEEMTFEEIAEIVGKPMNTIKSQYRRSLIVLKKYLVAPKL